MNARDATPLRRFLGSILAGAIVAGLATTSFADSRKFVVMLAVPSKSVEGGVGGLALPNPDNIRDQYLDHNKDNIQSFAEWWEEISYNNLSVTGDVHGWVEVPWPVFPAGPNYTFDGTTEGELSAAVLPRSELNGTGAFEPFEGETVSQNSQVVLIDYNGQLPFGQGTATPGFPPNVDAPTPGLIDFDLLTGRPVWTPGERFRDVNENGRYDALLEDARNGWNKAMPPCDQNDEIDDDEVGSPNSGSTCDEDGDGDWDYPEPFEDFLVIYDPTATTPRSRWIKLDPSAKNMNAQSRAFAATYIRANYAGDTEALIARCGNDQYDGADSWAESGSNQTPNRGSKLQQQPGGQMFLTTAITPAPDEGLFPWSYEEWWAAYWADKHAQAGISGGPAPAPPAWEPRIPNLQPFNPDNPSLVPNVPEDGDGFLGDTMDYRDFNANTGGIFARTGNDPGCMPDMAPDNACPNPPIEPQDYGDGTIDAMDNDAPIIPDTLDRNNDGRLDYYDGPAEFEDIPSSIYHARSVSGIGYGGDGRPGEVTSVQNTDSWGQDIGSGDPNGAGGPDGIIPAAGPLAYNIHGSNGYDAGNVLNLEFLTWGNVPAAPIRSLSFDDSGTLFGVDLGINELVSIDTTDATPTSIGMVQNGTVYEYVTALAFGNGTLYGISSIPGPAGLTATNTLISIDRTDGHVTSPTAIPGLGFPVKDMTFNPNDGLLWVLVDFFENTDLWTVDPATGAATAIVRVGLQESEGGAQGLAYDPDTDRFITVDLAFGWVAYIDLAAQPPLEYNLLPINDDPENIMPFDFDIEALAIDSGALFAADTADRLVSVSTADGSAEDVGTFGYAAKRSRPFKRDFNLDGLLDLGEVRAAGTESYTIDEYPSTPNDGGSQSGIYPFNRRRLTEDVVAALDPNVDWDQVIMQAGGNNFVHSTILIPGGLYPDGLAAGGRGLFQLPAPGMDLPIQVQEVPGNPISPILFSDFATAIGSIGENGQEIPADSFGKQIMCHEWGHVWEGYPDLYDYDVYISGIENAPVGVWDIMSGGFVHPAPVLKTDFTGNPGLGTAHDPWISVTDLRDVVDPFTETEVTINDFAFNPSQSVFVFQNPDIAGEKYYFWRITQEVPEDPDKINFYRFSPGNGVVIMHTDFGDNFEALPVQQRIGTHHTYNIVQADGLQQLENGENAGDSGDPFPGTSGNFQNEGGWSPETDPSSNWWGQLNSGLSIKQILQQPKKSVVTFFWQPRIVPTLDFLDPPGGITVGPNYRIRYEVFDVHGGTQIQLFFDRDTADYDGTPITPTPTGTNPQDKETPGVVVKTFNVPLNTLPGDGYYYFYAKLILGPGEDGLTDLASSEPRASVTNIGRGHVTVSNVNPDTSKIENWRLTCADDTTPGQEQWAVEGQLSGTQTGLATTGQPYTSDDGEVTFTINWDGIANSTPTAIVSNNTDIDGDGNNDFLLKELDPFFTGFIASEFKIGDHVRIVEGPTANLGFHQIVAVLDLNMDGKAQTLKLKTNPGNSGQVKYRVHSFTDGSSTNGISDKFSFLTTGLSEYSRPVLLSAGQIVPIVFPDITIRFPNGELTETEQRVPLLVEFDGTDSRDETGEPNSSMIFDWNFGDGTTGAGAVVQHTYNQAFPAGVQVTLTITNPATGVTGMTTATVVVNEADTDGDGVDDSVDNCPTVANALQENSDGDSHGDACDNCPLVDNENQANGDGDALGDACDPDLDDDGIDEYDGIGPFNPCTGGNTVGCDDNCPGTVNADQADADSDGVGDVCDNCPNVANVLQTNSDLDTHGDACDNCLTVTNENQADTDSDGDGDACDACPLDTLNDSDSDGVCDSADVCPGFDDGVDSDSDGVPDGCDVCAGGDDNIDSDSDGIPNACDNCPNTAGANQADSDGDGVGDICDPCPTDAGKVNPGACGCGNPDIDSDGDQVLDCDDDCPNDPTKIVVGLCGCGRPDTDRDSDGVPDCIDECPDDPNKISPRFCGCGNPDIDSDGDFVFDCNDRCPGFNDNLDRDGDGVPDGCDNCPDTANPTQADSNGDGVGDACPGSPPAGTTPPCPAGGAMLPGLALLTLGLLRSRRSRRRRRAAID